MNGKKAKAIRRKIYGDMSLKEKRKYIGIQYKPLSVTIKNHPAGLRAKYQAAKKAAVAA
jgi:hypothetical protein